MGTLIGFLRFLSVLSVLSFNGCLDPHALSATLNDRQITSCVYIQGAAGVFVQMRSVTATGGASLETCLGLH
jgi:hypothetical protein